MFPKSYRLGKFIIGMFFIWNSFTCNTLYLSFLFQCDIPVSLNLLFVINYDICYLTVKILQLYRVSVDFDG